MSFFNIFHSYSGQVTLNLLGGKFYKAGGGDRSSHSIWDRRVKTGSAGGREKKSRLSNIKTTFFTPIGSQSGYKRNKSQSRKYCQDDTHQVTE